jgi:hypothetical protein
MKPKKSPEKTTGRELESLTELEFLQSMSKRICICCRSRNASHYFAWPKDAVNRLQWALAMRVNVDTITNNSRICSLHFTEDQFTTNFRTQRVLAVGALPIRREGNIAQVRK